MALMKYKLIKMQLLLTNTAGNWFFRVLSSLRKSRMRRECQLHKFDFVAEALLDIIRPFLSIVEKTKSLSCFICFGGMAAVLFPKKSRSLKASSGDKTV
jgi:hypothetical protein